MTNRSVPQGRARRSGTCALWAVGLAATITAGCAGTGDRLDAIANTAGFSRLYTYGTSFRHLTISTPDSGTGGPVWVYLEGDGMPWIDGTVPSLDPTPQTPVALDLMRDGPRPALYLGRPCYHRTSSEPPCEPAWWTHRRFGAEIVASLAAALDAALAARGWQDRPIVLTGFSGGGTLATLLAPRLSAVCAVITIASPLDIEEWADSRGYSPMIGSQNPAQQPPLPERIGQLHLRSDSDAVVPPRNGAAFRRTNSQAQHRVFSGIGHGRDWLPVWQDLVRTPGALPVERCGRAPAEQDSRRGSRQSPYRHDFKGNVEVSCRARQRKRGDMR